MQNFENNEDELDVSEEHREGVEGLDIIDSLCMRCGGTGQTRLMIHKIPYFRELIIASFVCEECGERNNEVTFGGEIQLHGCRITLKVTKPEDLNRQIIKSDSAMIKFEELDLEIPSMTQKGEINTIEGILKSVEKNLMLDQPQRIVETPEVGLQISRVICKLSSMADGGILPFTIIMDDPAGNSFIQNPFAPSLDPNLKYINYNRSEQQDISLGLDPSKGLYKPDDNDVVRSVAVGNYIFGGIKSEIEAQDDSEMGEATEEHVQLGRSEVIAIPSQCPNCSSMGESLTALTDIPHFKEVIIMAFDCKVCGFRTNEVKGGGAVPTYGTEISLTVVCEDDLKRDVLKSDSTMVAVPELDLELGHGTLGGIFTTVEGLLQKIYKNLRDQNSIIYGDSATNNHSLSGEGIDTRNKFDEFLEKLINFATGKCFPFTLQLRDPLGNSFISAPLGSFLPPEADKNLIFHEFERSFEENDEFGLNDINTKDFETGYENDGLILGPVLPDRLTQVYHKGPDHPTPFAKGTELNDNTVGGIVNSDVNYATPNEVQVDESQQYYQPPAGWIFEKKDTEDENIFVDKVLPIAHTKRAISNDDNLEYIPREEFGGRKDGYVFRLGSKGLGYYKDKLI